MEFGTTTIIILITLVVFGIAYNHGVALLGNRQRGFTSILVALGVLVTLTGIYAIDPQSAIITLAAFTASGTPMIIGSIARYTAKRHAEETRLAQIAREFLDDSSQN